jgi:hypothetical protein
MYWNLYNGVAGKIRVDFYIGSQGIKVFSRTGIRNRNLIIFPFYLIGGGSAIGFLDIYFFVLPGNQFKFFAPAVIF